MWKKVYIILKQIQEIYQIKSIKKSKSKSTKFHQNRPTFVEDITENILVTFSGHTVYLYFDDSFY